MLPWTRPAGAIAVGFWQAGNLEFWAALGTRSCSALRESICSPPGKTLLHAFLEGRLRLVPVVVWDVVVSAVKVCLTIDFGRFRACGIGAVHDPEIVVVFARPRPWDFIGRVVRGVRIELQKPAQRHWVTSQTSRWRAPHPKCGDQFLSHFSRSGTLVIGRSSRVTYSSVGRSLRVPPPHGPASRPYGGGAGISLISHDSSQFEVGGVKNCHTAIL